MKRLTLICDCGKRKTFKAATVDTIIKQIDRAGWEDYSDNQRPLAKGFQHGICPDCGYDPTDSGEEDQYD